MASARNLRDHPPVGVGHSASMAPDAPDLSHLTLEERRIIEGVLHRQEQEERKDAEVVKKSDNIPHPIKPTVSSARATSSSSSNPGPGGSQAQIHPRSDPRMNGKMPTATTTINIPNSSTKTAASTVLSNMMSGAVNAIGSGGPDGLVGGGGGGIMDAVCGVCQKTKFADGLGHPCVRCKRKTCTLCGYQVNTGVNRVQWTCKPCAQSGNGSVVHSNNTNLSTSATTPTPSGRIPVTSGSNEETTAGRFVSGLVGLLTGDTRSTTASQPMGQSGMNRTQTSTSWAGGVGNNQNTSILTPGVSSSQRGPEHRRQLPNMMGQPRQYSGPSTIRSGTGRALPNLSMLNRSTSLGQDDVVTGSDFRSLYGEPRGYQPRQPTDTSRSRYPQSWSEGSPRSSYTMSPYDVNSERGVHRTAVSSRLNPEQPGRIGSSSPYNSRRLDPRLRSNQLHPDSWTSEQSDSSVRTDSHLTAAWHGGREWTGTTHLTPSGYASASRLGTSTDDPRFAGTASYSPRSLNTGTFERRFHTDSSMHTGQPRDEFGRSHEIRYPSFSSSDGEQDFVTGHMDGLGGFHASSERPSPYGPRITLPDDAGPYENRFYAADDDELNSVRTQPIRDYLSGRHHRSTAQLDAFSDSGSSRPRRRHSLRAPDLTSDDVTPKNLDPGRSSLHSSGSPLTQRVTWRPSKNDNRLIGHMILQKQTDREAGDAGTILGLKLIGGQVNQSGRLGAFISRIKPGSAADSIGRLRVGDEVLEWNGESLRGLNADQVSDVIDQSRLVSQVELIAQRMIDDPRDFLNAEFKSQTSSTHDLRFPVPPHPKCQSDDSWDTADRQGQPGVQLKLFFDHIKGQLIVNLLRASLLNVPIYQGSAVSQRRIPSMSATDIVCNTYCRIRLLPGRDEMKYSRMIAHSNSPCWNQVFKFIDYTYQEIVQHDLEVTLWNCEPDTNEQSLIGEVIIDLSVADLTDTSYAYPLQLEPSDECSSEAATPVVGSIPRYDTSRLADSSTSPTGSNYIQHPARERTGSLSMRRYQSGDYSDLDDTQYRRGPVSQVDTRHLPREALSPRVHRLHPRGHRPDYGPDEPVSHSDASELSDVSDLSRLSLRMSQTERHPQHHRLASSPDGRHITPSSNRSMTNRHPQHDQSSLSPNRRPSRRESSLRGRTSTEDLLARPPQQSHPGTEMSGQSGQKQQHHPQRMMGKESSSSDCGSGLINSSQSGGIPGDHGLGTRSDTRLDPGHPQRHKGRHSIGQRFSTVLGRSHKTGSATNLDKKGRTRFQRSEEVLPFSSSEQTMDGPQSMLDQQHRPMTGIQHQLSLSSGKLPHSSGGDGSEIDSRSSPSLTRNESHVGEFVEGLGPGQLVGRQVLGMPCLGEIQLSFYDRKNHLEVEVIRARGLQHKNTTKPLPAPYVKLHLLDGKQSIEKLRTSTNSRRTLDPLYQQQMTFSAPYQGKIMQISVWGEYGRMDKKVFLGMCEVVLDDLDLNNVVFGWYKLFGMIASSAHQHHHRQHHHHHSSHHHAHHDDTLTTGGRTDRHSTGPATTGSATTSSQAHKSNTRLRRSTSMSGKSKKRTSTGESSNPR